MVNRGSQFDWDAAIRRLDAEKRTLTNVAHIVWRAHQRNHQPAVDFLHELRQIRERLDDIIMIALEIEVYLSGHEKAMKASAFARHVGLSRSIVTRRINEGKIPTTGGMIPPSMPRKYGVGPFSPWPR
jgi:hypothetical protein